MPCAPILDPPMHDSSDLHVSLPNCEIQISKENGENENEREKQWKSAASKVAFGSCRCVIRIHLTQVEYSITIPRVYFADGIV